MVFILVKIKKDNIVNNSEIKSAAQIQCNPTTVVRMNKTIGKKMIDRQAHNKFEYFVISMA